MAINTFSGGNPINSLQAAGKNAIMNGDFYINQRAFTSTTTDATYTFDRWQAKTTDGTNTFSSQTFTPGTAPVAGYEGKNYLRIVTSGQTATNARTNIQQPIENVRVFAGQTVTVSFWAKAASGTPSITPEFLQSFGTGGSPSSVVNTIIASPAKQAITTSWARYSFNISVPSISGKTVGTTDNTSALYLLLWVSAGSDFNSRTGSLGIQTNTFEFWGVQVELGTTATTFTTATGTIQGELAACQRYFERTSVGSNALIWSTPRAGYFTYYWKVSKRNTSGTSTLQQTGMYISAGTLSISGGNSTDSIGFFTSTAADIAFNTGYVQIDNEL